MLVRIEQDVIMRHVAALGFLLALTGCNTVTSLSYRPSVPILRTATPVIASVAATDQRREAPTRLATIMGGFGNPLKTLDTAKPVKDEVAVAFVAGLRVRGLLALEGGAPYRITLVIRKFDADMIMGRTARIDITMAVVNLQGVSVYEQGIADQLDDFKFFQTGVMADIGDLQLLSETLLGRTVDRLLDDPAFRLAIAKVPTPGS
jgi:hypothetical protein